MYFSPFVLLASDLSKVKAKIVPMTDADAQVTICEPVWQSDWVNSPLQDSRLEKYALKTEDDELVALGAYEIRKNQVHVHIVYIESHPESNPTMTSVRKYFGIGKLLIAFGIKLSIDNECEGCVTFEAKTPELARHYAEDFGAELLPNLGGPPRYMLEGNMAREIFISYLE